MADNYFIIHCPACGKKMTKIYMEEQNLYLDVCLDGCGGIYFDNREFRLFDRNCYSIKQLKDAYSGKIFTKVNEHKERICPCCRTKMVKNYSSPAHEIQIDDCYSCGGKFLDYGELEKIRNMDKVRRTNISSSIFEEKQYIAMDNAGLFSFEKEKKDSFNSIKENKKTLFRKEQDDGFNSIKNGNEEKELSKNGIMHKIIMTIPLLAVLCIIFHEQFGIWVNSLKDNVDLIKTENLYGLIVYAVMIFIILLLMLKVKNNKI